ncbi:MAG: hypothetical protein ABI668_03460 [Sphingorhabdus sp.]
MTNLYVRWQNEMDAILAVIDAIGQLFPPKDERERRWYRVGCFTTLFLGALAAIFIAIAFFSGGI